MRCLSTQSVDAINRVSEKTLEATGLRQRQGANGAEAAEEHDGMRP